MGKIISDIGSDINSVVDSVGKLVTDVSSAVGQLTTIASGFSTPPAPEKNQLLKSTEYVATLGDPEDINSALKSAMSAAQTKVSSVFSSTFSGVTAAGVDNGVVSDYVTGEGVSCVIKQMTQDFKNWQIDADNATIEGMANTIATQISAQIGIAGTSQGHHSINMNQQIDWAVAYGLFAMGNNQQGLVYAYTAALDSGF